MKVLVATTEGQGARDNDFSWTTEGEFVHFSMECDGEEVDGTCGCRRSMAGCKSFTGTTTVKVVELSDLTREEYEDVLHTSFVEAGWTSITKRAVQAEATELLRIADSYAPGTILERRGDRFANRII